MTDLWSAELGPYWTTGGGCGFARPMHRTRVEAFGNLYPKRQPRYLRAAEALKPRMQTGERIGVAGDGSGPTMAKGGSRSKAQPVAHRHSSPISDNRSQLEQREKNRQEDLSARLASLSITTSREQGSINRR